MRYEGEQRTAPTYSGVLEEGELRLPARPRLLNGLTCIDLGDDPPDVSGLVLDEGLVLAEIDLPHGTRLYGSRRLYLRNLASTVTLVEVVGTVPAPAVAPRKQAAGR